MPTISLSPISHALADAGFAFALEPELPVDEFVDVLRRAELANRPLDQPLTIAEMIANADILVTARHAGKLIGIARSVSDFAYCTYLSDLAVDQSFQKRGIGKELIAQTHRKAGLHTSLILLAAPAAREYYPRVGFAQHPSAWIIRGIARQV